MSLIYPLPATKIPRSLISSNPVAREYFEARDALDGLPGTLFDYMVAIWENSDARVDMNEDEEADENDALAQRDILNAIKQFCQCINLKDASHTATAKTELLDIANDYGMEDPEHYEKLNQFLDEYEELARRCFAAESSLAS